MAKIATICRTKIIVPLPPSRGAARTMDAASYT